MNAYDYDLFVIGAGSGGVRAARISAGYGARVAIAEEYRVGGTCVIRGCVPKKLLVYGAHFAEDLEDARHFGWAVEGKRFDWATLRDNVLSEVDRLNKAYISTLESQKVTILHGRAVLEDAHTMRIGDRTVTADKVLIATGAHPGIPDCEGAEHGITSNEVFHLETLPKRVAIAGGGYIANEFAGIFNAFGVKVTLLLRGDRLLREYDQQLAERLQAISTAKGIDFRFNAPFRKVEKQADGSLLIHAGKDDPIEVDLLVYAIGRPPNSAGLGLEAIGVDLAENGAIKVDADSRTNIGNIYAVGDVTDRVQLTPVAIREGHAFADTVFGGKPWRVDHGCIPSAVFSHPPIAAVGLTEAQARNTYGSVRVYASDFRPMKNVLANRSERSLYKLVVDEASGRILGAHIIGPEAAEIMQPLAIAVKAGLTKAQLDETVAIHPTMAEELVLMR
ncbi:glutathione-disulfide reductase [Sphingosinicella microcystinivorans]|uniref:glutathione-disulfide reductase n=1 Tax=Sphingosinicella microcystinivorans TaxID=335406 RepID=UPI0022F3CF3E|nr:glutathione-disulfide reductase [Sphingosinicella microcystinivorans]WBX82674.1 glutathione-disulfide reductase [Sphingosinicella microcystinivorans]